MPADEAVVADVTDVADAVTAAAVAAEADAKTAAAESKKRGARLLSITADPFCGWRSDSDARAVTRQGVHVMTVRPRIEALSRPVA